LRAPSFGTPEGKGDMYGFFLGKGIEYKAHYVRCARFRQR